MLSILYEHIEVCEYDAQIGLIGIQGSLPSCSSLHHVVAPPSHRYSSPLQSEFLNRRWCLQAVGTRAI